MMKETEMKGAGMVKLVYKGYNCLKQVPKGALVYLSGFHSDWYLRKNSGKTLRFCKNL